MGVSPGTGAGIGIALGLLILFIAGPVAYKHNKKRRLRLQSTQPVDNTLEDGEKAQLDGTPISPTTWRDSNYAASVISGPETVPQTMNAGLGIQQRPISEAAGSQVVEVDGIEVPAELHARDARQRAELDNVQSAYGGRRAELRADALTPPESLGPSTAAANALVSSRPPREGDIGRTTSDTSLPQMPVLPGPILPPKGL